MHVDINSCFATVEQQFDHTLRNKPIAVVARNTVNGTIIAPSIEAKKYGIKTGMGLKEAKAIYPKLISMQADPPKYRYIHKKLFKLLLNYSYKVQPKSIDEFVIDFDGFPGAKAGLKTTAKKIKQEIKKYVGDWIRVSIGIGPNRFYAKTAAGIIKPDGLVEIDSINHKKILSALDLNDLPGIGYRNEIRLNNKEIFKTTDFLNADINTLKSIFKSVNAYYWYLRLRGWEIDNYETKRSSFSASYVLPHPINSKYEIQRLIRKLAEKTGNKLMENECQANGAFIYLRYTPTGYLKKTITSQNLLTGTQIFNAILQNIKIENNQIRHAVVGCFNIKKLDSIQVGLFNNNLKNLDLQNAIKRINKKNR